MTTEPAPRLDPRLNILPADPKCIHLMGICGTAMAALAGMLKERGYTVSGSDSGVYPPMSDFLEEIGIRASSGYRPENLVHAPDLVIVGNVITRDNPEAQALARAHIPYLSMPQALARFFISGRRSLVVAGTHGKTTTSSILASALYDAGCDPSFMIGGIVEEFQTNYRLGRGPCFITEGDEYDTAFFNKVSKFLHYLPEIAVITSIEFDHADIFASLEEIKDSFRSFIRLIPPHGRVIARIEDENVAEVVSEAPCPVITYGTTDAADWRVEHPRFAPGTTRFTLSRHGEFYGEFSLKLPGLHNCLNGAAVVAVMSQLGFQPTAISDGLRSFAGVKRRQEIRGTVAGITVVDDFAHHPTAVRATLEALKNAYPQNRLIAVFEPRTNTSRRALFQQQYAGSFGAADRCLIREPDTAKQNDPADQFSAERLAADLTRHGTTAESFPDTATILAALVQSTRSGDLVAILSNGGFDQLHQRLLEALRRREADSR